MEKYIILLKCSNREILLTKDNSFLEFSKTLTITEIKNSIEKKLSSEIEFSSIFLLETHNCHFYGNEFTTLVFNITDFKITNTLSEFKVLNPKVDKIDNLYGFIITEFFPQYRFYSGFSTRHFTKESSSKESLINRIDLLVSLLLGISIGIFLFYKATDIFNYFGIWVTLVWAFITTYIFIFKKPQVKNKFGIFLIGAGILLSLCFTIFSNVLFTFLNFFIVPFLIIYGFNILLSVPKEINVSEFLLFGFFKTFIKPFLNFTTYKFEKPKSNKKFKDIFIGVLISVPILIILSTILISGNSDFKSFIQNSVFNNFFNYGFNNIHSFFILISSIFFTVYLLGMFRGLNLGIYEKPSKIKKLTINSTILNTVIVMVNLLYITFCIVSLSPSTKTYSEIAREGFFTLFFVMIINMGFILFFHKRSDILKGTKFLFLLMLILSLFMGANALLSLGLYIKEYGLTELRFLSTLMSIFLNITLLIIILNLFKTFKLWNIIISLGLIMYIGLNFCNMDRLIVSYNLRHNKITALDVINYYYFSKDAKFALLEAQNAGAFNIKNHKDLPVYSEYDFDDVNASIKDKFEKKSNLKWFEYNYYNN